MNFESLAAVFARVAAGRRVATTFTAAEACAAAERIIAAELPRLAADVKAKFVKHDTLHIAVRSSVVGSEVQLASDTILREIQQRFPKIKKLRIGTESGAFVERA